VINMSEAKSNRMKCMVKQTCDEYTKSIKVVIGAICSVVSDIQEQLSKKDNFNSAVVSVGGGVILLGLFLIMCPGLPYRLSNIFICLGFLMVPLILLPVYTAFYNCYVAESKGKV
jgi:hypothetical protein